MLSWLIFGSRCKSILNLYPVLSLGFIQYKHFRGKNIILNDGGTTMKSEQRNHLSDNQILLDRIVELTAKIYHFNDGSIMVEDSFIMALGEAEVYFNTDLNMDLTEDIKIKINKKVDILKNGGEYMHE